MTRMFPMTVIRLRDPATRMMRTISTVEYGLPENRLALSTLVILVTWEEFRVSMLSGFGSHSCSGFNHIRAIPGKHKDY